MADHHNINSYASSSSSDIVHDPDLDSKVIHKKIKSAFSNVFWSSDLSNGGLLQFWAPVEFTTSISGKTQKQRLLSTSNRLFVLEAYDQQLNSCFLEYFKYCLNYLFSINPHDDGNVNVNMNNNKLQVVDVDDLYSINPMMITCGGPSTAFLDHLPSVENLFGCFQGLRSLFLPVFSSPQSSCCVGVIECSITRKSALSVIFKNLKAALERVGLTTFHVQENRLHKTVCGLQRSMDEIKEALEIVRVSHGLSLGQVWVASENENRVLFSFSTQTKVKFAVRLIGYCADFHHLSATKDYYDTCDAIPLKLGEGLGRTLQTYEPHFYSNAQYSRIAICLRSVETGENVDYVFEFSWPQNRNYLIMIESLMLTLNSCLPSFIFPSGAHLGDELRVLDGSCTIRGIGSFMILRGNKFSKIPKTTMKQGSESVTKDCVLSSVKETAPNLNVQKCNVIDISKLQRPMFVNRKLRDYSDSEVDSNQEYKRSKQEHSATSNNSETSPKDEELVITAEFKEKISLFNLSSKVKVADLKKKIEHKFKLVSDTYELTYPFDGDWIWVDNDADLEICISLIMKRNKKTHIQLKVNLQTKVQR